MLAAWGMAAGPVGFRCGLAEVSTEVVVINPAGPARGEVRISDEGTIRWECPFATALRRARDLAAEMGHRPLLAEIERELPRVVAERSGNELTAAERRVADLIAGGAANRVAAAALFVGVRRPTSRPSTGTWACVPGPTWPDGARSWTYSSPRRRMYRSWRLI